MWSEKVNSLYLRGTPIKARGLTPGRDFEKEEVWGPRISGIILVCFYVTLVEIM